ncbi:MAG: J domain-containing protein [Bacteroidia bacterium]|nr:J domain-containing protein [Bacteroidia bacterium]
MKKTLHEILNISSTATLAEIKKAYRQLCKMHHPDKNQGSTESENLFKEINAAYQVLIDQDSRAKYDSELQKAFAYTRQEKDTHTFRGSIRPIIQMVASVIIFAFIIFAILNLNKLTKS